MKRWAFLVAGLYVLAMFVLTVPVVWAAFTPHWKPTTGSVDDLLLSPYLWILFGLMFVSQLCLLIVPVKITRERPISRRALLWPILTGGFLAATLLLGAGYAIIEFLYANQGPDPEWLHWIPVMAGALLWLVWSLVFYRHAREQSADNVVRQQSRWLLRGSILELLIAVPTHILARYRDYCCAGFMTFIGITFGIAVMLFAFGPSVFFLFVARWKRLHPQPATNPLK